jgi:P-type E1-E2 ATPase
MAFISSKIGIGNQNIQEVTIMLQLDLPGRNKVLNLEYLVLDMNGTISVDGQLPEGLLEKIAVLKERFKVILLTADTFGKGQEAAKKLDIDFLTVSPENGLKDKQDFVERLDSEKTVAIGNGFNDMGMLKTAALSIVIIGREGCCVEALKSADIAVCSIMDALDLLINPLRIIATLRC